MWIHKFLDHWSKKHFYLCPRCESIDVVTDRFREHLKAEHRIEREDVEPYFMKSPAFIKVFDCEIEGCTFHATNLYNIREHLIRAHSNTPPADICRAVAEIEVQRQEAVRQGSRRERRNDDSVSSTETSRFFRHDGEYYVHTIKGGKGSIDRVATPQRHDVYVDRAEEPTRPRTLARPMQRVSPTSISPEETTPQAQRTRRRVIRPDSAERVQEVPQDVERRRILNIAREMGEPRNMPRRRRTPLENMVRIRPNHRYVAMLEFGPGLAMLVFMHRNVGVTWGSIMRGTTHHTQFTTFRHEGDPETGARGCAQPWRTRGPVYDVYARPWQVVLGMAVGLPVPDGIASLVVPTQRRICRIEIEQLE